MIKPKDSDIVEVYPTMHDAGVILQEQYPLARDLDRQGQHWVSTVVKDVAHSRTVFPLPVTMRIRPLGWMTLIELTFQDEFCYRFIDSRDGFEDHKAYLRGVEHIKRLVPDLKILSAMDLIRSRKAESGR